MRAERQMFDFFEEAEVSEEIDVAKTVILDASCWPSAVNHEDVAALVPAKATRTNDSAESIIKSGAEVSSSSVMAPKRSEEAERAIEGASQKTRSDMGVSRGQETGQVEAKHRDLGGLSTHPARAQQRSKDPRFPTAPHAGVRNHRTIFGLRPEWAQAIGLGVLFIGAMAWSLRTSSPTTSTKSTERTQESYPRPERLRARTDRVRPEDIEALFARRARKERLGTGDDGASKLSASMMSETRPPEALSPIVGSTENTVNETGSFLPVVVGGGRERRSTLAGFRAQPPPSRSEPEIDPSFFRAPTTTIVARPESTKPKQEALGLVPGDLLDVRLQDGATSEAGGVILAEVTDPFRRHEITIPAGALLKGRAWAGDRRLYVDFYELLIGSKSYPVKAAAVDGTYPGLRARRREASVREKSRGGISRGLISTGSAVTGALSGAAGEVADNIAHETTPIAKEAVTPEDTHILEVPARYRFRVRVLDE